MSSEILPPNCVPPRRLPLWSFAEVFTKGLPQGRSLKCVQQCVSLAFSHRKFSLDGGPPSVSPEGDPPRGVPQECYQVFSPCGVPESFPADGISNSESPMLSPLGGFHHGWYTQAVLLCLSPVLCLTSFSPSGRHACPFAHVVFPNSGPCFSSWNALSECSFNIFRSSNGLCCPLNCVMFFIIFWLRFSGLVLACLSFF